MSAAVMPITCQDLLAFRDVDCPHRRRVGSWAGLNCLCSAMEEFSWSHPPSGVLEEVLKRLDLADRLATCGLVCRAWHTVATATTTDIEVTAEEPGTKCQAVVQWLQKQQGSMLTQLSMSGGHGLVVASLPCPRLRELLLHGFKLQLTPRAGQPGLLHAATGLTKLVLLRVTIMGGAQQLTAMSVLTGLKHLVLSELQETSLQYAALPSSLLQKLQQLTHLHVTAGLSDTALQHLSCLTCLQHLQLERLGADTTPAAFAAVTPLQRSLTALLLEGAHFTLGDVSTPALAVLTRLCVLQLHACDGMQPGLVSTVTGLQVLQLKLTPIEGGSEATGNFLALLPKLRHLTALELQGALVHAAPSPSAYSVLTASTVMQDLQIANARLSGDAWQAMFPAQPQRKPAQLTSLRLAYGEDSGFGGNTLRGVVKHCPHLQRLHLHGRAELGNSLTELLQLSALTELSIDHVTENMVTASLVKLTGLSSLLIVQPSIMSDAALPRLAALTQLTYLWVASEGLSKDYCNAGGGIVHLVKSEGTDAPSVAQQLEQHCRQVQISVLEQGYKLALGKYQEMAEEARQRDDHQAQAEAEALTENLHRLFGRCRGNLAVGETSSSTSRLHPN